jgi:hypothetical protein
MIGFGVKAETCSCCKQKEFEISVGVSLLLKKQAVEMLTGFDWGRNTSSGLQWLKLLSL